MSQKNLVGMSDLRSSSYSKSKYIASVGVSWPEGRGAMPQFFRNRQIFGNFMFRRKIYGLLLLVMALNMSPFSASATTPLNFRLHVLIR